MIKTMSVHEIFCNLCEKKFKDGENILRCEKPSFGKFKDPSGENSDPHYCIINHTMSILNGSVNCFVHVDCLTHDIQVSKMKG